MASVWLNFSMFLHEEEFKVQVSFIHLALVFVQYLIAKITETTGGSTNKRVKHGCMLYSVLLYIIHVCFLYT